jgi:hypothetical protein
MARVDTREPTRPDTESEQTHDDCDQLNEEDGEEDVPGNRPSASGSGWPPAVAQNQSRRAGRQDNPDAEHRRSNGGRKRGVGLIGIIAL